MRSLVLITAAACLGVAGWLRLASARTTGDRGARFLAVACSAVAAALAIYAPIVYRWLDRDVFARPNVSELAGHLCLVVGAWASVSMVSSLRVVSDARVPRLIGVVSFIAAVAMSFAFLTRRFPVETTSFTTVYGRHADVRIYWAIVITYLVLTLGVIASLTARASSRAPRRLRAGLRLVAAGAVLGTLYFVHWGGYLVALAFDRPGPDWIRPAALSIAVASALSIAAGTSLPVIAERRAVHKIRPLWAYVTAHYPQVRSHPTGRTSSYRLVLEIRDAVSHLQAEDALSSPVLLEIAAMPAPELEDLDDDIRQFARLADRQDL